MKSKLLEKCRMFLHISFANISSHNNSVKIAPNLGGDYEKRNDNESMFMLINFLDSQYDTDKIFIPNEIMEIIKNCLINKDELQINHMILSKNADLILFNDKIHNGIELKSVNVTSCDEKENIMGIFKTEIELSQFYSVLGRYDDALKSANLARGYAEKSNVDFLLAMALQRLGHCWIDKSDPDMALKYANKIISLMNDNTHFGLRQIRAVILRAQCNIRMKNIKSAEKDLQYAWNVLCKFSKTTLLAGFNSALSYWWEVNGEMKLYYSDTDGYILTLRESLESRLLIIQADHVDGIYKYMTFIRLMYRLWHALMINEQFEEAMLVFRECLDIQRKIASTMPFSIDISSIEQGVYGISPRTVCN